jgi:hypothetical protein
MKVSTLLFSILFLFSLFSHAQNEWAPEGATWHFEVETQYMEETTYHPMILESLGDTIYEGQNCSKILLNGSSCESWNVYETDGALYTYQQNDSVFFFNSSEGYFQLMMDFSMEQGDTLTVPIQSPINDDFEEELQFLVDSVGIVGIEDHDLKRMYLSTLNVYFEMYDGDTSIFMTETLGIENYLTFYSYGLILCETLQHSTKLRCYSSPSFGTYQAVGYPCDTSFVITDIPEIDAAEIRVYPNPADQKISLEFDNLPTGEPMEVSIFDLQGRKVKSEKFVQDQQMFSVDSSDLPDGTYLLKMKTNTLERTQKIIVQH